MRFGVAIAIAAAVVAVLVLSSWPEEPESAPSRPVAVAYKQAREGCSTRSMASFPGAFTDRRVNLVAGPMSLIGAAAFTTPETVREYGGNKFPVVVKAGHRVTVRLAESARGIAGLAYGPLPQGEVRLDDAYEAVTFVACRRHEASGSDADGAPVTFWSGFVMTREPRCVRLEVRADGERTPRRVGVPLGRRC